MSDDQFLQLQTQLTRLETHMEMLVGNGQPGRIQRLEDDISQLQATSNQSLGKWSVITVAINAAFSAAWHKFIR